MVLFIVIIDGFIIMVMVSFICIFFIDYLRYVKWNVIALRNIFDFTNSAGAWHLKRKIWDSYVILSRYFLIISGKWNFLWSNNNTSTRESTWHWLANEVNVKQATTSLWRYKHVTVPCYSFFNAAFKWYTFNNIEVISTLSRINMYDSLKNSPSLLN